MSILSKRNKSNKTTRKSQKSTKSSGRKAKWAVGLGLGVAGLGNASFNLSSGKRTGRSASSFMSTAVPQVFNTVVSNPAHMSPERAVFHKTLGLQGIRIAGSQYFCQLQMPLATGTAPSDGLIVEGSFYGTYLPQFSTAPEPRTTIGGVFPFNPLNVGGPIAEKGIRYQRWRANSATLRYVNSCGTAQPGTLVFGYYKDYACATTEYYSILNFRALSDLVPSTAFPVTIPTASCSLVYEGPELYYIGSGVPLRATDTTITPSAWGDAQNRQEQQGALVIAVDTVGPGSTPGPNYGHVYLDYDIEFYDPWPANSYAPITLYEHNLVKDVLAAVRQPQQADTWAMPAPDRASQLDGIFRASSAAVESSAAATNAQATPDASRPHAAAMDDLIKRLVAARLTAPPPADSRPAARG